jgi:hypothetical protein
MPIICFLSAQSSKVQFLQLSTLIKITSDIGVDYKYLLKQYEDARKDMHVMNFVSIINQIFPKDRSSKQRNLSLTTYLIIYLDQKKAMIDGLNIPLNFSVQLRKLKLELTPHRQQIIQMSQNFLIEKNINQRSHKKGLNF